MICIHFCGNSCHSFIHFILQLNNVFIFNDVDIGLYYIRFRNSSNNGKTRIVCVCARKMSGRNESSFILRAERISVTIYGFMWLEYSAKLAMARHTHNVFIFLNTNFYVVRQRFSLHYFEAKKITKN